MKGQTFRSLANAHDFKPSLLCSSAKRSNSSTSLCGLRIGSSFPNSKPLQSIGSNHWTNLLYILLQLVHLTKHSLKVLRRRSASEHICCWDENRCEAISPHFSVDEPEHHKIECEFTTHCFFRRSQLLDYCLADYMSHALLKRSSNSVHYSSIPWWIFKGFADL